MPSTNNIEIKLHDSVRFNRDGNTIFGKIVALCTKTEYHDRIIVQDTNKKIYFPAVNDVFVIQ